VSSSPLVRWGGLGAILAGVLFMVWGYVHTDDAPPYSAAVARALGIVVPLLFVLALAGLHARCKGRASRLRTMTFVPGFVGSGGGVVHGFMYAFDWYAWYVHVEGRVWLSTPLDWSIWLFAGLTLIGVTTIRTKALWKYGALSLVMGVFGWVYYFTDFEGIAHTRAVHIVFGILFGLSWVALGYGLRQEEAK
jgi:hypothetical protein